MNSLNRAEVIGNVTRDPELKTTKSGQPVTTIGVATNRGWTDSNGQRHDEAEFHSVVCWGRLAEIACQFLKKGMKVYFSGRLRTRNWDDESGVKHYRTEIVAQDMIILSPKGYAGGDDNSGDSFSDPGADGGDMMASGDDVSAEDLPF